MSNIHSSFRHFSIFFHLSDAWFAWSGNGKKHGEFQRSVWLNMSLQSLCSWLDSLAGQ